MLRRINFRIALFCLVCAFIGTAVVAGLFSPMTSHRSREAGPRVSQDIHHVLTGGGNGAAGGPRDAALGFSLPGARWIEAPIHRSCRPMGRSFFTPSTRSLPACLTV